MEQQAESRLQRALRSLESASMREIIEGPRQRGRYPGRRLECQRALEPVFLELVAALEAPDIDLIAISGPIFEIAYAAGWSVDDVASAVEELAVDYQLAAVDNAQT